MTFFPTTILLTIACICTILEVANPGLFYFLSFALGALCTLSFSYSFTGVSENVAIQLMLFFITSIIAFLNLHRYAKAALTKNLSKSYQSNSSQLIGQTIEIINVENHQTGHGKINGEIWLVKLQGNDLLTLGMHATIIGVQGCHLQIKAQPSKTNNLIHP